MDEKSLMHRRIIWWQLSIELNSLTQNVTQSHKYWL